MIAGARRTRRGQAHRAAHRDQAADRAGVSRTTTRSRLIRSSSAPPKRRSSTPPAPRCCSSPGRCMRAAKKSCSPAKARTNGCRLSVVQGGENARRSLDVVPGLRLSDLARRAFLRLNKVPQLSARVAGAGMEEAIGGPNAWIDSYGLLGLSKLRFYGRVDARGARAERTRGPSWGSRSSAPGAGIRCTAGLWVAARVTLAGHLLQAKGDRVAMHSSVEVRYPFLDEDVFDFMARLHPRWKLRGFRDKHLLRLLAERWVPREVFAAAQGDLPRAARQLPHGSGAAVRRATAERRIAATHRLFRRRRRCITGAGLSARCGRTRCRASPSKWASPPSSPRSSGIIFTSTATLAELPGSRSREDRPSRLSACHQLRSAPTRATNSDGRLKRTGESRTGWKHCPPCKLTAALPQFLAPLGLHLGVVLLCIWHRQSLGDKPPRVRGLPHLSVGPPEFDIMPEPMRVERDRFVETLHRLLIGGRRQLAVDQPTQRPLDPANTRKYLVPAAKDVPGEIVVRDRA